MSLLKKVETIESFANVNHEQKYQELSEIINLIDSLHEKVLALKDADDFFSFRTKEVENILLIFELLDVHLKEYDFFYDYGFDEWIGHKFENLMKYEEILPLEKRMHLFLQKRKGLK